MLAAISDTLESIEEEFLSADARVKEVFNHWKEASPSVGVLHNAMRQYQRLHIAMLQALSNASALVGRVNQLSSHLKHIHGQQELILAVESGRIEDTTEVLDKFREDRRVAVEEAENSKDQANSVSLQVHALKQHRESLYARLEELEDERRLELASHIKSARDEVDILRDHVAVEQLKAQTARGEMLEIVDRLDMLHGEIGRLANLTAIEQQSLKTADGLPEHSRKEADAIGILLKDLVLEEEHLNSKLNELNNQLEACDDQAGEILSQQGTSATAGEKLRSRLADKKRANDELTRDIEMAKLATEQHLAERVTLSMELDKLEKEEKLQIENVKNGQRTRGFFLQRVKKEEHQVKQAQDEMLPLDTSIKNMTIQIVAQKKEFETLRSSRTKLQAEVQDLLGRVAEEKSMTEVQKSLVKARLRHVHELDKECSDIQVTVYKREKLAQRAVSGRDRAGRQASSLIGKLHDALELAEAKDGQVDELRQRRRTVRAQEKGLRSLCGMLREQMGHCISVHKSAERCVQGLEEKVKQAEDVLKQMSSTADCRTADLKKAESVSRAAGYTRAQLTNCLAACKQKHNAVYAEIDQAMLNVACLKRAVEDGKAAHDRMAQIVTAAADAKCAAEQALVGRGSELCKLYEQSNACQILNDEGKQALSRCSDDIRLLQLEVAELERKLLATHKTAPDVVSYDHSVAQLKAEVFKARREAEQLSVTLEDPSLAPDRWRLLPGSIPSRQELTDRMGKIESKLSSRLNQIAQKELTLEELQGLIDSLVQQAAATHDGAFQLSVQMNDCQRGLQGMTRRMMATVSELALYQALSIKYAAGREALQAQLAAARSNMDRGVAPTGSADQEYARLERTAAQQAEVRQQAAEVRQLKEAGLLGQVQSRASPRPHAYLPDTDEGLPRPFLAPFAPFKPTGHLFAAPCPAAPTIAQGSHAVNQLVVGTAT